MTQTLFQFRSTATWLLLPAMFLLFACQDDAKPSGEEDLVLERERIGNKVSFEVRDFAGDPIPVVVIFEELDASGGAVYRFEHGQAQIMFQPAGSYTLQAEGFEDLNFKVDQIEDVRRFTFYLHKKGSAATQPSIEGQIRRRSFRPYPHAQISSSAGEVSPLGDEGDFRVTPSAELDPSQPNTLSVAWVNDEQESRSLDVTFPNWQRRIRLDVYLETDTPAEIRN